ncbi:MAG: phosphoglycerate dehydrogenase [Oscillospiraceae bacterium]|nr:phosphoglycerate dehydrogenase [Oscillospiraceae bacterium]
MAKKVALMTRHHSTLICQEARELLTAAGFEIVSNDTGRILTPEEQKALIKDVYAIVAGTEKYPREMLEGCDNLKVVTRFGVGTDNFDLNTMREMGLEVGVIANHNAVAEFALTLMLNVLKNQQNYDPAVRQGMWSRFPMRELSAKTVGIVGFGRIGRRLAELLSGFGVKILAYDPYLNEQAARERNVTPAALDELLAQSDIVSLHLPSTPQTHHMINAESIAKMKDGAYLVNTSRGSLVDEKALYDALVSGKLSGAGLDVFEQEPVTAENPLFTLKNTALAPHVSALTYETNYNGGIICAQSIVNVAEGGKPLYPLW